MRYMARYSIIAVLCLHLGGCGFLIGHTIREITRDTQEESQVVASLARYRSLVIEFEPDLLADMFVSNGELSHNNEKPHIGQVQIRTFLRNFRDHKFVTYDLKAVSTKIDKQSAKQTGTYAQKLLIPGGRTIEAAGSFEAVWQHQPDGRWLLSRMHTISDTGAGGG